MYGRRGGLISEGFVSMRIVGASLKNIGAVVVHCICY